VVAGSESIAVLFTDLVGSTELASSLSPDAADELRRNHFSVLRQAIASSGGTEVKNLGDGLMVVFPAASAALACGVAMQQAVHRANVDAERPLGIRVGISAGEATREAEDYFGDPVIEAARLCARAESGQILVADLVRASAGRRSPHAFVSMGELELKGLPEPIETLEVSWEPMNEVEATSTAVPLPERLAIVPLAGVVAREAETELLADVFKRVATGSGREVMLVSGEAGLGKTTLVAEAARRSHETGACVLLGRCEEDLNASYAPFAEALHHYVAHADEDLLREHVATHGGELARMVPALGQRLGKLPPPTNTDPDTERYLLFGAVVGLVTLAASRQPLVLVLDDLQWSDKPSLQLLRYLVANVQSPRLLVLATYRDAELSGSHPLTDVLGALRREPNVGRIELKGFDDTGVLAFMEAAAGHRLEDDGVGLAHALYRETDGNPFFVGVVLLHLIETGAIYQEESGRWVASGDLSEIALPNSVREVISARVARLGERAGKALTVAAVIGRDFDFDLLAAVTEFDQEELLDILDAAAAATLVREVPDAAGRWSFWHALTQHTLYQDLGATRRARAHRQVAEALESLYGENSPERVGELAHHWANATQPVDAAKAISYARQAGEAALDALAPDDAVRHFSRALEFFGQQRDADRLLGVDLLLGLGESQRRAGIAAYRETFLDAARQASGLGATDRLVRAALANSRGAFSQVGTTDADRVAVLEAALDAMSDDDSADRALLLATLCQEVIHGPFERRRALADDAKAMGRRLGDPGAMVRVLNLIDQPIQVPSTLAERLENSREALALAESLGDPECLFWAAYYRRSAALQEGAFENAAHCLGVLRTVSERIQQPIQWWRLAYCEASEAMVAGEPDKAEEFANAALQWGLDSGQPDALAFYGGQLSRLRFQQGRQGELTALIEQAVADNPGTPAFRAALAMSHMQAGDDARAIELLKDAAADNFASLPLDYLWLLTLCTYAEAAIQLRVSRPAQQLYDLLEPFHDQIPYVTTILVSPIAFYLGGLSSVLGRGDEAEAHFAEALELANRGGMKFDTAYTQYRWGCMLAARGRPGDIDRARALLQEACDSAAVHGYGAIERSAAAELSNLA
jgi:class 3 adenylate cyclase/tetratricopeptide (TPR) repeat protein